MAQKMNYPNTKPRLMSLDEMFDEYLKSKGMGAPKISDYKLTNQIISFIENPESLRQYNEKAKSLYKSKKKDYISMTLTGLAIVLSAIVGFCFMICTFVFKYGFDYNIDDTTLISFEISIVFCIILLVLLIIFGIKPIKEYIRDRIEGECPMAFTVCISNIDKNNYSRYEIALKEWKDRICKLQINISWKDVTFKDGEVVCFVQIFNKSYSWNIEKSRSVYDRYRLLLMEKFPSLYFTYSDGHLHLFTDGVNTAIDIIIAYMKEEEEERERKEREQRERERIEIDKVQNDFYNTYPYFNTGKSMQAWIRNRIKQDKSIYLDYLLEHQLEGIDIMQVDEDVRTASMSQIPDTQEGYIFTLKMNASSYCVIYENIFDDKASIKYVSDSLPECLVAAMDIKQFMQGTRPNKREYIMNKKSVLQRRVRRIMHDDFGDWKQKLHSRTFK